MSIILLILGLLILISKKNTIKYLFKTKEQVKELTIESFEKTKKSLNNNSAFVTSMVVVALLISLMYILFYILSGIFIGNFLFVIISILMIFDTIRQFFKGCNTIIDITTYKGENVVYRYINLLIDLSYIAVVFYSIYISW